MPPFRFLESVVMTGVVGRDQAYLDEPGVRAWSMQVDPLGINPFNFSIDHATAERLYESGRKAATDFLARQVAPVHT